MGSNVSCVEEKKRSSVASAQATAVPRVYKRSNGHRWPSPTQNGGATTAAAAAGAASATADAVVVAAAKYRNKIITNDMSNEVEIIRPTTILDNFAKTNKRVISFRSSDNWREYFEASKQSHRMVVVFFTASWCGYCRYMGPILHDFAAQYTDVEFNKIDVDAFSVCILRPCAMNVSREFGVHAMPTFLLIKRGQVIDKVTGAKHQDLRSKIEKHRT